MNEKAVLAIIETLGEKVSTQNEFLKAMGVLSADVKNKVQDKITNYDERICELEKEIFELKQSKERQAELLRDIQGLALEARTKKGLVDAEKIMELIFGNKPKEK
jgi:phosphopantetheine adenylyltransferase